MNTNNQWNFPQQQNSEQDISQSMGHIPSISKGDVANFMTKVYGWMFLGLAITAGIALWAATNEYIINTIFANRLLFFGLMIGQLFLVGYLAVRIHKMTSFVATSIFLAYAALNGLTFSVLLLVYTPQSIVVSFGVTAITFGIMSLVGYTTKTDLTSFGKLLMMGLIGLVVASIVNIFLKSPMMYYIISYVGVAIFVGLIAYDTQKIKQYAYLESEEERKKGAVMGALALYLDFVNLFIFILRLFGDRR